MPSAVLWSRGRILVGHAAVQAMLTSPELFEPSPKRRLADGDILLGDDLVPVAELVASVLREVTSRATRVMGAQPETLVLTHPDKWSTGQQRQLADAAASAGLMTDRIVLVSEATAAARFYTATGAELPVGARVAVCDFGAGTVDVAVLDKQPSGGFAVVAADGVDGLGGHDLDARIQAWVRRQLLFEDPGLAAELDDPTDVAARLMLTDRIRDAKEALSEATSAAILVRGAAGTRVLQLTRDEFDGLIVADVDRAVELTRRVLADADRVRPATVPPTIYLVGGSSAIPLVHSRLAELGRVATMGDPKTVVCQGALQIPADSPATPETEPPAAQQVSPTPVRTEVPASPPSQHVPAQREPAPNRPHSHDDPPPASSRPLPTSRPWQQSTPWWMDPKAAAPPRPGESPSPSADAAPDPQRPTGLRRWRSRNPRPSS